jgi:hypothetical protein
MALTPMALTSMALTSMADGSIDFNGVDAAPVQYPETGGRTPFAPIQFAFLIYDRSRTAQ